ncbi:PI-PLC X domain-containing protein 1 [Trichoderma asperellum]|uniref:PI-PLC X domain-containing protein 1 n=1 Tax=Trichoderma asperellum TaxID=101201 RepID=A0A6V8QN81_TRIAP|nr:PI-PLC X domain-containing protein 1 [Trichoderma asperellum]
MRFSVARLLATALIGTAGVQAVFPRPEASEISSAATPSSTASASSSSSVCNNSPVLCDRHYNDITYMGAHDSAFLRDASTGNSVAGNQFKNATFALDAGLRFLQAQVHNENNTLRLCHTSCGLLDAGPLETWLAAINDWVVGHPSDVITLLLVNSDNADVSKFADAFEKSGIDKFGFTPTSKTEWPSLAQMIANDTRVVSFITNIDSSSSSPHLLPEFNYIFETPFTVLELDGFNCTVDRPSNAGPASNAFSKGLMGLVNHFKDQVVTGSIIIPDTTNIDLVNSAATNATGNLGLHIQQCNQEWSHRPSFVLVDFWDQGSTVKAADNSNGISDATGRTSVASNSSGSSSADGVSSTRELGTGALIAFFAATLLMI